MSRAASVPVQNARNGQSDVNKLPAIPSRQDQGAVVDCAYGVLAQRKPKPLSRPVGALPQRFGGSKIDGSPRQSPRITRPEAAVVGK
jgi:hypothetical protein